MPSGRLGSLGVTRQSASSRGGISRGVDRLRFQVRRKGLDDHARLGFHSSLRTSPRVAPDPASGYHVRVSHLDGDARRAHRPGRGRLPPGPRPASGCRSPGGHPAPDAHRGHRRAGDRRGSDACPEHGRSAEPAGRAHRGRSRVPADDPPGGATRVPGRARHLAQARQPGEALDRRAHPDRRRSGRV